VDAVSMCFKSPLLCHGVPAAMKPVFGISPFRLGELSPQDVLRTAFSAVQDAREAQTEHAVFSVNSDEANRRRITLLTDMREALIQDDQLSLAYQPRIDLRSGECISAEALLRWKNRRYGNVSPGEFIPLVEQTALARPVTQWVIRTAIQQAAAWRSAGHDLRVSINVSALNLEEADFVECFAEALKRGGVAPSAVELELTESALIRNSLRVVSQIQQLRSMGVELAIDDFGTGYSTFAYLQKIPASTVKLDQSFIRMLHENKRDQLLVRSMILMAHDLGYRVVAEGVETAEICSFLRDLNCDEIQGYFISRPLPVEAFDAWLHQHAASRISRRGAAGVETLTKSGFSSSLLALRQVHLKAENSYPLLDQSMTGGTPQTETVKGH
jgi:EAL domain-containing protein (putative c-di-GMP-specific phosphodiesterase class I)